MENEELSLGTPTAPFHPLAFLTHNRVSGLQTDPFQRSLLVLPLVLCVAAVLAQAMTTEGHEVVRIPRMNIDSICYFSNAHSLLFRRTFDISKELSKLPPDPRNTERELWVGTRKETGLPGSPYAIGTSLLQMPFLLAGTALDWLAGDAADGYGPWAIRVYYASNIVFASVGALLLYAWMKRFAFDGHPSTVEAAAMWTTTLLVFPGTPLGFYVFIPMSHAASFLAICTFLFLWSTYERSGTAAQLFLTGCAGGLVFLVRWQDALFLLVPLLTDFNHLWTGAFDRRRWLTTRVAFAAGVILLAVPQLVQWKLVYGSYLTVPQGDGFIQLPPQHIGDVLFSTVNGLFAMTPMTAIGAAGLLAASARHRTAWAPLLAVCVVELVLMGSMPTNWNGKIFAMRNMTSCVPLFAAGQAWLLSRFRIGLGIGTVVALTCALFTTLFAAQWVFDMYPKLHRLTVEEYVIDKLRFDKALMRFYTRTIAEELLATGNPEVAARVLSTSLVRHGSDRRTVAELAEACALAGDTACADRATQTLADMNRRVLW